MVTIQFDKKVKCGPEFVALRIIENCDELNVGGIYLADMVERNARLARCRVEDVGSKSSEEYGIKVGDYVMIDRLSTFAHTAPVCVCKYNNVICLTNEAGTEFKPLRNMLFVQPDEKDADSNVNGIYVRNYDQKLNIGTIVAENVDKDKNLPFAVNDKVIVTKGADVMELGDRTVYIYKHDMIVCKVED